MKEIIDYNLLRKQAQLDPNYGLAEWAFIEAFAQVKKEDKSFKDFDPKAVSVDLKINGVPVSFLAIMKAFNSQADELIAKAALRLFDEKLEKFETACTASADRLTKLVKAATVKARKDIGLPVENEDERRW